MKPYHVLPIGLLFLLMLFGAARAEMSVLDKMTVMQNNKRVGDPEKEDDEKRKDMLRASRGFRQPAPPPVPTQPQVVPGK